MYLLLQMHRPPPIISCPKHLNVLIRLLITFSIFCELKTLTVTLEFISYLLLFLLAFIDKIETSNPISASKLDKTAVHLIFCNIINKKGYFHYFIPFNLLLGRSAVFQSSTENYFLGNNLFCNAYPNFSKSGNLKSFLITLFLLNKTVNTTGIPTPINT